MLRLGLLTHNFPIRPEETPDAGSFVSALATMVQGPDCEVIVFCQSLGKAIQPPDNIKIEQFSWPGEGNKLGQLHWTDWRDLANLVTFVKQGREGVLGFIRDYKIDHCLALWVVPAGYFAYYARKETGVPYTVWALGSDINQYYRLGFRRKIRRILTEADHVFADGLELVSKINDISGQDRCRFFTVIAASFGWAPG